MKKRMLLIMASAFILMACGSSTSESMPEATTVAEIKTETQTVEETTKHIDLTELDEDDVLEVDKGLLEVTINIPKDFVDEGTTQESLNAEAGDGYISATLNDDGSITVIMTSSQHADMMIGIKGSIESSLHEMIESEDYPTFTEIIHNDDFSDFIVKVNSSELGLTESFSVIGFTMYGGMYNVFNGTTINNVHVDFVNSESGELIDSFDSTDMQSESAE